MPKESDSDSEPVPYNICQFFAWMIEYWVFPSRSVSRIHLSKCNSFQPNVREPNVVPMRIAIFGQFQSLLTTKHFQSKIFIGKQLLKASFGITQAVTSSMAVKFKVTASSLKTERYPMRFPDLTKRIICSLPEELYFESLPFPDIKQKIERLGLPSSNIKSPFLKCKTFLCSDMKSKSFLGSVLNELSWCIKQRLQFFIY